MTTVLVTVLGTLLVTFMGSLLTSLNDTRKWRRDQLVTAYARLDEFLSGVELTLTAPGLREFALEYAKASSKAHLIADRRVIEKIEEILSDAHSASIATKRGDHVAPYEFSRQLVASSHVLVEAMRKDLRTDSRFLRDMRWLRLRPKSLFSR